jgi:hypothetical protein
MSRTEIAAVAVRLLALAMFAMAAVTGLRAAVQYFVDRSRTTITDQFVETNWQVYSALGWDALGLGALVGGGVWLLLATYYWQRAEKFAERMVDDAPEAVTRIDFTADDVFAAGCRLIGVVLLVRALRAGVWIVSEFVFPYRESFGELFDGPHGRTALQVVLEAGLAIWLLFGTRGIIGIVTWARNAGTRESRPGDSGAASPTLAPQAVTRRSGAVTAARTEKADGSDSGDRTPGDAKRRESGREEPGP